jgi:hypothetical protein
MTSEDIRNNCGSTPYWLREIAAQLAELNENIKRERVSQPKPKPEYELCDTVFPSGEKCVRPKNHHKWSQAACSPTIKFMEYSADTQCEEAKIRVIENEKIAKMRKK